VDRILQCVQKWEKLAEHGGSRLLGSFTPCLVQVAAETLRPALVLRGCAFVSAMARLCRSCARWPLDAKGVDEPLTSL
jgi:hypothetical protein